MQTAQVHSSQMFIRALFIDQFFFKPASEKIDVTPVLTQRHHSVRGNRESQFIFLSDKENPNFSEDCGLKAWKSIQFTT
jgi:hypothetical protein